ncbi:MAG: hypothetical protein U0324_14460 [Polyangiales bacterium]
MALRASDASAAWRQYSVGSNCAIISPSPSVQRGTGDEIYNHHTTNNLELACAFLESSAFTKSAVAGGAIELEYSDTYASGGAAAGQSVAAQGCVAYASLSGGSCDSVALSPSGAGAGTLNPSVSMWATGHSSDFAYLFVSLPPRSTGTGSSVWGYRFED